jgi:hypothetical protein
MPPRELPDSRALAVAEQGHQLRGAIFFRAEMLFTSAMCHANTRRLIHRPFMLEIHNALVISGKHNGVGFFWGTRGQFYPMHERYPKTPPSSLIHFGNDSRPSN